MSLDNLESTDWLDAELRRVSVPEGLVTRLCQVAADGSDEQLDGRLRDVPLPADLLAGLKRTIADVELDGRLAEVAVPSGLVARLQQVIDNAVMDDDVADVATPAGFISRLRRAAMPGPLRRLALAASLFVVVGVSYATTVWMRGSSNPNVPTGSELAEAEPNVEIDFDATVDIPEGLVADDLQLVAASETADSLLAPEVRLADHEFSPPPVAEDRSRALVGREGRRAGNPLATHWQAPDRIVGFTVEPEKIPSFQAVLARHRAGIAPPLEPGYDRAALARFGVHPFVQPGRNDLLRVSVAPLSTRTDSFDLLLDRLTHRARTSDIPIRPEDFLAAMSYGYPPANAGQLALRTAAGPAPLARDGVGLIQIGVQAGPLATASRPAVHLTIAVDSSAAMQWHGRLSIVREALVELIGDLQPDDRVSLVAFSDRADLLATDMGPPDAETLRTAIGWVVPEGAANLPAGLRAACGAAIEGKAVSSARRCVVVISDSIGDLPLSQVDAMERMISRVAREKADKQIEWSFIELAGSGARDATLNRLARVAGGRLSSAESRRDLQRRLAEVVSGRSNVVARGAELRVLFNPKAVAEYRLVGHEPSDAAGWSNDSATAAELDAGQSATALYQVILHENNVNDVATAEVIWRDAATGKTHRVTQRISRLQFATSFLDSAMSLQAAALAAETAEILRGSPFAPRGAHSLERVLALAAHANPQLTEQREFKKLIRLTRLARQAGMDR
jgi:Ca-activated chloride channel family protein